MCGIGGILLSESTGRSVELRERLSRMACAMQHRGPDDEGIYISPDERVGLASRRLAIRDLSPLGHMPMGNAEGTLWLSYNGEVYNADELRRELQILGYVFRSHSDTEVILHGYAAWGQDVVLRLRGMFAFAVCDLRPRSQSSAGPMLFLARDRLGIKPLYYALAGQALVFASELRGLQASGLVSREIGAGGLVGYLLMGSVPNPLTIYRDVRALEPGCTLSIPLGQASALPEPQRYWKLPTETVEIGYEDAVAQVRETLGEAVRMRLVSDVPLGAFLSGGLDSSAVVALMRQSTSGPIRTCSMVFEEAGFSEAPYARAMAEAVGAEHFERVITANDLSGELDNIFASMDQPTLDGVNTYFVSQTARQAGLTVALSGLGGDELFGGYSSTFDGVPQMLKYLQRAQSVPGGASLVGAAMGMVPQRHRLARVREALQRPASPASAYLTRRGLFSPREVRALVSPEMWREGSRHFNAVRHVAEHADLNGSGGNSGLFEWTSRAELSTYTHHQLLRDTDAMSMAHSLEVRVPLLDHVLVEQVLKLPESVKRKGEGPKPLLNAALRGLLPAKISERRDKQGFTFPFDRWIQKLRVEGSFGVGSSNASCWKAREVEQVWSEHASGRMHWSRAWAVAVAQRWMASG